MSKKFEVSLAELLDSGAHFGHKTHRWNPKMAEYIYGEKEKMHIIDLQATVAMMEVALAKIYETVKNNGKVLFVGSKVQATQLIAEYAEKCAQFYVNSRWLGGTLTNWDTISRSIKTLDDIEKTLEDAEVVATYTKKEVLDLSRKKVKLLRALSGIRKIGGCPDLLVVIDTNKERLAVTEARKLGIPVVAIVDTNCDPDDVDYPIPGNDDAIRAISLYCRLFSDAALAGIQDSLVNSGVDIGDAAEGPGAKTRDANGIKKLDKVARAPRAPGDGERKNTNNKPGYKPRRSNDSANKDGASKDKVTAPGNES